MDKQTYQQQKSEKEKEKQRQNRAKFKRKIGWTLFSLGVAGSMALAAYYYVSSQPPIEESDIVSRNGMHWHPHLSIIIDGQAQQIPAGIGLGVSQHYRIHTHEADGVIHLEYSGLVTKDNIRLKEFFKIWGKRFDKECIFEFCNNKQKQVKFLVNGQENQEFENYIMRDNDRIEIRYE